MTLLRHAADQKSRIAPRLPQQKRGQRRRGGLPVRAGDDKITPALQDEVVQHRGERGEGKAAGVEQPLHLGIAPRHGIADHHEIGRESLEPGRIVTLVQRNSRGREHGAHRRINAGVRT